MSPLIVGRAGGRVTAISERFLCVVGGCDDVFGRAEMLASIEILDTWDEGAKWATLDVSLSTPRTTAAVVAVELWVLTTLRTSCSISRGIELVEEDRYSQNAHMLHGAEVY